MYRFIGAQEHGGRRWSPGDEIDLFFLDQVNDEFADNAAFVLAGACQLAVGGLALVAAILM